MKIVSNKGGAGVSLLLDDGTDITNDLGLEEISAIVDPDDHTKVIGITLHCSADCLDIDKLEADDYLDDTEGVMPKDLH